MLENNTSTELLKNIAKLLKETDVKMDSLSRLREALNSVAVVLDSTINEQEGANPTALVRDIIEPRKLGILFTYFKDLRLTKSRGFLQKKQEETGRELSILEKRKQRLQICQGSILEDQKNNNNLQIREPTNLPKIEEHRACTPITKVGRICRDENGLLEITEEKITYEDDWMPEEEDITEEKAAEPLVKNISRTKHQQQGDLEEKKSDEQVAAATAAVEVAPEIGSPYSGVIDLDVMEKLDGMNPEERADYTAQFYRELLEEDDWLFPVEDKPDSLEVEGKSSDRQTTRKQKAKRSSQLYGFFNKKQESPLYGKNKQAQSVVQTQEQDTKPLHRNIIKKRPVILKKLSKGVSRKRQMMEQRQPTFLQDAEGAPFTAKIVERTEQNAAHSVGKEQKTKKLSRFKRRQMNLLK